MMNLLAAVFALLGATQDVENPQFQYWATCKPGSWSRMMMTIETGGNKVESEMTYTLKEIKDDVAILEITGKSKFGAQEYPVPAQKQEVKAKEPADKIKIEKEGEEEIEVAGKKLKCHRYEFSSKAGDKPSQGKAWMSKEIPGGMARGEMTPPSGKPIVLTAVEWEKK